MNKKLKLALTPICLCLAWTSVALATDVSTGNPCNLGITDFMDRREIFLLWTVPPAVLGGTGLVVAWWFNRMRRSRESSAAKTRWGILVGFSLAISILSGMFLVGVIAVDRFQPGWLY